jgi:hypothetical protein
MAKSTRSKVKRSFRAHKRETGIYAATEAARLNRLHAKLSSVASKEAIPQMDAEGMEEDNEGLPGWSWFTTFGLLDAGDITAERMGSFANGGGKRKRCRRRSRGTRKSKTATYCGGLKENFA